MEVIELGEKILGLFLDGRNRIGEKRGTDPHHEKQGGKDG